MLKIILNKAKIISYSNSLFWKSTVRTYMPYILCFGFFFKMLIWLNIVLYVGLWQILNLIYFIYLYIVHCKKKKKKIWKLGTGLQTHLFQNLVLQSPNLYTYSRRCTFVLVKFFPVFKHMVFSCCYIKKIVVFILLGKEVFLHYFYLSDY